MNGLGARSIELEAADGGVAAGEEALDLGQKRAPERQAFINRLYDGVQVGSPIEGGAP